MAGVTAVKLRGRLLCRTNEEAQTVPRELPVHIDLSRVEPGVFASSLSGRMSHYATAAPSTGIVPDACHPLLEQLAHLESTRTVGVGPGNGYYHRPRPKVVKRRFAYDRDIIRAIDALGCFFPDPNSSEQWTGLGDVDVVFLDKDEKMLGATVTHEGLIIMPDDEDEFGQPR